MERNKRRESGYLTKVEGNLREIERLARTFADPNIDVTPDHMWEVMVSERRALRALGLNYPHPMNSVPERGEAR